MDFEAVIAAARDQGASDVHLEPGLPVAMRLRGVLRKAGEAVARAELEQVARELVGDEGWAEFIARGSHDGSRTIRGTRCRFNVMRTARGVGMAIRLLASFQATLERLNLHPGLRQWLGHSHGLILVCGPTGSGKSSTLAALVQEINLAEPRHIVTVESPVEYFLNPRKAFIRQREVGRDTPSFEQALVDALREDPDVLMVGEMREPETMRLTLNAAETGHLVLTTVHSSSCIEALQRIVASFPPETQSAVAAQLADCLIAVMAQRLEYRSDLKIRVPECEILIPTSPVKAHLRSREFFRIQSVIETGAESGMWTWARYRQWMSKRSQWFLPDAAAEAPDSETTEFVSSPAVPASARARAGAASPPASKPAPAGAVASGEEGRRIEIEPIEGGIEDLLRRLK